MLRSERKNKDYMYMGDEMREDVSIENGKSSTGIFTIQKHPVNSYLQIRIVISSTNLAELVSVMLL
jgi:hypothetical protein